MKFMRWNGLDWIRKTFFWALGLSYYRYYYYYYFFFGLCRWRGGEANWIDQKRNETKRNETYCAI
ncbi:uncharacterized protein MYCFIDRAFT_208397 [Pseudocercospora fijiensis CIRAD86]|uniref:Uncharacterized protein n=1 Tax=Pseudocercospora fijiensis (strain CIRAD86) TaxID=383855 RepID=M3AR20_PSEFD|nr:uncharacterized protein MYCFIDRAFT_208397 [Pseudocercospora fijiensis CIRAD86]EME79877.1 hypothetical protein MYCFIDRAFT_208397 [Pseudocercospora fijiensis CIRAD86]